MSEFQQTTDPASPADPNGRGADVVPLYPPDEVQPDGTEPPGPKRRVKLKKLRLFLVLSGVGLLAVVSTVFGMMMAVASDLPQLEALDTSPRNSVIYDRTGRHKLGLLTGNQRRLLLKENQPISPSMRQAIIAIEDRRFFTNPGVDLRGIARALWQDVIAQKAVQGGSTITQQFVKNALEAQNQRTLFQKLREAAMAYHMTKKWSKEKILRNYLNTIYFGNGAYGLETAASVYFGYQYEGCESDRARPCAARLEPHESALLAGMVANPTGYDPTVFPAEATARRNVVLDRMRSEGYLSEAQYRASIAEPIPTRVDIRPPQEDTEYPYFTSWVKQQVVDKLGGGQTGARRAFEGGLAIETTLDADLQDAAQQAVDSLLPSGGPGPQAAMVAIDNRTSEVLAMVGGDDAPDAYTKRAFNLATQGQRQPGSSFKPFILAKALDSGISADSVWTSKKKEFCVVRKRKRCVEAFPVNNYEDAYAGITTLARATTFSDNSVYAEVGIKIGTKKIARLAERMGVRTPVSSNPAMTLGGLRQGVTVLDMAHAYQTFANHGKFMYGSMSPGEWNGGKRPVPGPVAIREMRVLDDEDRPGELAELPNGDKAKNERKEETVLPRRVADQVQSILSGVVNVGTGVRAKISPNIPAYGKTGTTENYGDAWFVGWTNRYTVAVWVGYPDELIPMQTEFNGEPVAGGTFPAMIWRAFMVAAEDIYARRHPDKEKEDLDAVPTPGLPTQSTETPAPEEDTVPSGQGGDEPDEPLQDEPPAEAEPVPQEPEPEPTAPPQEEPPPEDDGGGTEAPGGGAGTQADGGF